MKSHITSYFDKYSFCNTEREVITSAYDKIRENPDACRVFDKIITDYDIAADSVGEDRISDIRSIGVHADICEHTVALLALICLSRRLGERLADMGVPDDSIHLTLADLTYKMRVLEKLCDTVGTKEWAWHTRFLRLGIIAFGRLQFEITTFPYDSYEAYGKSIKKGDTVLSVHIPDDGTPLCYDACLRSYKLAREFFSSYLGEDNLHFICSSWLLYPKNREFLPPDANIPKFMAGYDIIDSRDYDFRNNPAMEFLFKLNQPPKSPDEVPGDTRLRRAYLAHIAGGGSMGYGFGVLKE